MITPLDVTGSTVSRTALIVDDYEPNRTLLQDVLELEGYRVLCASDGESALRVLATVRPSVILLDMKMPGMNGWELVEALQADDELSSIPVVLVTADRRAKPAAAAACIRKPYDLMQLLETVEAVVH